MLIPNRTKRDWESLVKGAGLKLVKIWQTSQTGPLAVVECMLKDKEPEKDTAIDTTQKDLEQETEATVINGHGTEEESTILKGVEDHEVKFNGHAEAANTTTTEPPAIEA